MSRDRDDELEQAIDEAYEELEADDLRSFQLVTVHGDEERPGFARCAHTWYNGVEGNPARGLKSDTQRALGYALASTASILDTPLDRLVSPLVVTADNMEPHYHEERQEHVEHE